MTHYTLTDTSTFERFTRWIDYQKSHEENILLIHDVDGDGISAAKILLEGLQKLGVKVKFRFAAYERNNLFGEFLLDFIQKHQFMTIILVDLNLFSTNFMEKKELFQNKNMIVFDHHETPSSTENFIYFHPLLTYKFPEPSQYCTAKLAYDLLSELVDVSDLDWVASIGLVADVNYSTWKDFVDLTLHRLGLPVPSSPFDSELQKVGTFLYYALAIDRDSAELAIKAYLSAHSYQEALLPLQKFQVVEKEINFFLENWRDYTEEREETFFIKIEPKYKINSLLSSRLSLLYQNKTVLVLSPIKTEEGKEAEMLAFSIRRQDGRVNLPALLKEISSQLEGMNGGGHIQAVGAKCQIQDYSRFKELFLQAQEKFRRR